MNTRIANKLLEYSNDKPVVFIAGFTFLCCTGLMFLVFIHDFILVGNDNEDYESWWEILFIVGIIASVLFLTILLVK